MEQLSLGVIIPYIGIGDQSTNERSEGAMHLFDHIRCYPYPIYVYYYPISPCYCLYYRQQKEVIHEQQQVPMYNGHEHGKG